MLIARYYVRSYFRDANVSAGFRGLLDAERWAAYQSKALKIDQLIIDAQHPTNCLAVFANGKPAHAQTGTAGKLLRSEAQEVA